MLVSISETNKGAGVPSTTEVQDLQPSRSMITTMPFNIHMDPIEDRAWTWRASLNAGDVRWERHATVALDLSFAVLSALTARTSA